MSLQQTTKVTPTDAITELLTYASNVEATNAINDSETQVIESDDTIAASDHLIGGDMAINGTVDAVGGTDPFTLEAPNVYSWWEKSQSERGPGQDQLPELHVWQPTSAPLDRITAENSLLEESSSVEIYVYTLNDADACAQYARDLINYLSAYMSDRERNTTYADIVPTNVEDFREQKLRQKTNHFVYTVECEITHIEETGV
jgi:hypothetical protein